MRPELDFKIQMGRGKMDVYMQLQGLALIFEGLHFFYKTLGPRYMPERPNFVFVVSNVNPITLAKNDTWKSLSIIHVFLLTLAASNLLAFRG